jgi:hypothetical protein
MKGTTMKRNALAMSVVAVLFSVLTGCSHYYKVNDPAGQKEYYTKDIDTVRGGAIKIKDAKSGATVTLQSSEVKEISEEEFEAAVKGMKPKQEAPKPEAPKQDAPK